MKKILLTVFILLFVLFELSAITVSDLNAESLREYNNKILTINTGSSTVMSGGSYKGFVSLSGNTKSIWEPFEGNTKISKLDFYNITGYSEEANRYKEMLDYNRNMNVAFGVIYGVGLIVGLVGLNRYLSAESIYSDEAINGQIVTYSGCAIMLSSIIPYLLKKDGSDFSQDFAKRIAEDYNKELIFKLIEAKN